MRKPSVWSNRTFEPTCACPFGFVQDRLRSRATVLNVKRFGGHACLFAFVDGKRTDRRAGTGVATGVGDLAAEELAQARLDETPTAHVLRFFLAPDQLC